MSKMSDYLEGQLRAHLFRTASFTKPAGLFVSLHTADPTDAATGAEVSGGSYARVTRAPLDANWTAASSTDGITTNAAAVTFPAPTANWGVVTHFAIWDASTAATCSCYGALGTPKTINNGDAAPAFRDRCHQYHLSVTAMAQLASITLTVGDRQRSLRATLKNADGSLATLTAVVLRMVTASDPSTVKINNATTTIESPGVVRYDWAVADVNAAGLYYLWLIDTDGSGRLQHWPDQGRAWAIEWVDAA